jgi:hypothetical protein
VRVGDWIQNRERPDEVFLVEGIELTIDETLVHEAGTGRGSRLLRQRAVMPLIGLRAPTESSYPGGFTQYPADFRVISVQEMEEVKASWRTRS